MRSRNTGVNSGVIAVVGFALMQMFGCAPAEASSSWTSATIRERLGRSEHAPIYDWTACVSEHFKSTYSGGVSIGRKSLELTFKERDPMSRQWHEFKQTLSFSYYLTSVHGSPDGHNFAVAGVTMDGKVVVELIQFETRKNGIVIRVNKPDSLDLGVPLQPFDATEVIPGGYVAPKPKEQYGAGDRKLIFSGTSLDMISTTSLDPELRFLIVQDLSGSVYQLDLTGGLPVEPNLIFSVVDYPDLGNMVTADLKEFSQGGGRAIHLTQSASDFVPVGKSGHMLLLDPDNDGLLTAVVSISAADWYAAGYHSYSAWNAIQFVDFVSDW